MGVSTKMHRWRPFFLNAARFVAIKTLFLLVLNAKCAYFVVVTDMLDCFGTLNGVDPSRIVTLSGTQTITGTTTFKHLEVVKTLEVRSTYQL